MAAIIEWLHLGLHVCCVRSISPVGPTSQLALVQMNTIGCYFNHNERPGQNDSTTVCPLCSTIGNSLGALICYLGHISALGLILICAFIVYHEHGYEHVYKKTLTE